MDLVPDDDYDPGFLKAYDAAGDLLQDVETAAPPFPGCLTMTVSRPSADISYIVAGGQAGQDILLDHLVVNAGSSGGDYYGVAAGDRPATGGLHDNAQRRERGVRQPPRSEDRTL